jgi:excisionase family DNA binding protein
LSEKLFTAEEVADYLGMDYRWVLRNKHTLPTLEVAPRTYRFRRSDIDRWLETRRLRPLLSGVRL